VNAAQVCSGTPACSSMMESVRPRGERRRRIRPNYPGPEHHQLARQIDRLGPAPSCIGGADGLFQRCVTPARILRRTRRP
jgi:hypothetical protein